MNQTSLSDTKMQLLYNLGIIVWSTNWMFEKVKLHVQALYNIKNMLANYQLRSNNTSKEMSICHCSKFGWLNNDWTRLRPSLALIDQRLTLKTNIMCTNKIETLIKCSLSVGWVSQSIHGKVVIDTFDQHSTDRHLDWYSANNQTILNQCLNSHSTVGRSPSLGACNYPIFLSQHFHRPIYF